MRSERFAWLLSAALLLSTSACKEDIESKVVADPLDDPWVDAIDTGDDGLGEEPVAAAPADPTAEAIPTAPGEIAADTEGDPEAAPPPEAEAGAPEVASASAAKSGSSSGSSAGTGAAAAPEPGEAAPAAAGDEPAAGLEPVAIAEPTPAPEPAPKQPEAPPPLTIADFDGSFRFVGGSAQRQALEQAIETAADQLPAAFRGIGRRRLTKTNPIDDGLVITITGDKVKTAFSTGFDAECVIDGATIVWTSKKNDKYKVRVRKKGTKLVQIIAGNDGVKTTVFVLSSDKKRLTVHHKISADRLPEPMTYKLSYARK
jgi:hypothetical protein